MRKRLKLILLIIVLIILGEVLAIFALGLGEQPIYIEDNKYEYMYAPLQGVKRFGNFILTNEYSMRSLPLKDNENRVLIFGDSVLNGGNLTDHDALATTLLENDLQKICNKSIRILNISAGSWGPDNAFSYLQKYGDFNASSIILVFSSHDAYDNMKHEKIVGQHLSYPSSQPCCALWDGFNRYFIPRVTALFSNSKEKFSKIHKIDQSDTFNTGWKNFIDYTKKYNIKLFVVLHPDKQEFISGQYNKNGIEIINFLKENNIPYLLELNKIDVTYFRDAIHYNNKGQRFLYEELKPILEKNICLTKKDDKL